MRRGFWTLRLCTAVTLRRGFQPSRLGPCSDVETRVSTLRLGAALVAMISLASGVWILLLDDLSSVIFRQPTEPPPKFSIFGRISKYFGLWLNSYFS